MPCIERKSILSISRHFLASNRGNGFYSSNFFYAFHAEYITVTQTFMMKKAIHSHKCTKKESAELFLCAIRIIGSWNKWSCTHTNANILSKSELQAVVKIEVCVLFFLFYIFFCCWCVPVKMWERWCISLFTLFRWLVYRFYDTTDTENNSTILTSLCIPFMFYSSRPFFSPSS